MPAVNYVSTDLVSKRTGHRPSTIDYAELPASTPEQLIATHRVGRPPIGDAARQLIAIRIDPGVLKRLRQEAKRRRMGYQTLVNEILVRHVQRHSAKVLDRR